jgi:hypothetical protein
MTQKTEKAPIPPAHIKRMDDNDQPEPARRRRTLKAVNLPWLS